jgi:hypothetical protein
VKLYSKKVLKILLFSLLTLLSVHVFQKQALQGADIITSIETAHRNEQKVFSKFFSKVNV